MGNWVLGTGNWKLGITEIFGEKLYKIIDPQI